MKISSNWLSEFISLNNKTIEQELTQLVLEVDTISKNKNDYIIDIEFTPNREIVYLLMEFQETCSLLKIKNKIATG